MTVGLKILGAGVGLGGGGMGGSEGDKWPPQCGVEAMGEATVRKSPWLLCPVMHRGLLSPPFCTALVGEWVSGNG